MSVKTVSMLLCDGCGGRLVEAGRGTVEVAVHDILGAVTLREAAARHGWTCTGREPRDLCRFCAAVERAAKRAEAKARKAAREAGK